MRFMMIMLPGSYDAPTEADVRPMMAYNEELTKAGVLLALDGLQPPEKGARVTFAGGRPSVTDGPFAEAKEVIGGYWIIQAKSKEEAVEWASRCPAGPADTIEVRQVFEIDDFDMDVPELSKTPPEQTSA
jgi:hypothetical protein